MIRLILTVLYFVLILIETIIAYPLSRLIGLFSKQKRDFFCLRLVQFWLKSFLFIAGTKLTYKGLENLPQNGEAAVFIGNHRGFFDVVATYAIMPGLTGFIAKKEMKSWPVVGWWMSSVYCLFLDRVNKREGLKTILTGIDQVKRGISMVIYPEGTRSKTEGKLGKFHNGSFKLATKSGAPIIPVASSNSAAVFEDQSPFIKRASMTIEFCPPIETKGLTNEEIEALPEKVRDIIYERVIENSQELGVLPEDYKRED